MWWPAHFDQHGEGTPSVAAGALQQILPPAAPAASTNGAAAPPTPFETPLPDWTRIGGSTRYR
jgi:hypothetical protein